MVYKNMVSVKVFGRTMTLSGNESVEYITKVANYIEEKANMLRSSDNSKNLSAPMVSVLTSLNIADDYFKALDEIERLKKEMPAETDDDFISKGIIEELNALRKENAKLKEDALAYNNSLEIKDLDMGDVKRENESLRSELEALKTLYADLKKKNISLEEEIVKKDSEINKINSVENRFIQNEKRMEALRNNYEKSFLKDELIESSKEEIIKEKEADEKTITEEASKEIKEETPVIQQKPFHMNNAKLKKAKTNVNYYRHI